MGATDKPDGLALLFPVVILKRSLKRLGVGCGSEVKPLPAELGWMDALFRGVLAYEANILGGNRSLPFGLSVIACVKKPEP